MASQSELDPPLVANSSVADSAPEIDVSLAYSTEVFLAEKWGVDRAGPMAILQLVV